MKQEQIAQLLATILDEALDDVLPKLRAELSKQMDGVESRNQLTADRLALLKNSAIGKDAADDLIQKRVDEIRAGMVADEALSQMVLSDKFANLAKDVARLDSRIDATPSAQKGDKGSPGRDGQFPSPVSWQKDSIYPYSTVATFKNGLWFAHRDTQQSPEEENSGWSLIADALHDIDMVWDKDEDIRNFKVYMTRASGELHSFDLSVPFPVYRGVWKEGNWEQFDYVTHKGSMWMALNNTDTKPGTDEGSEHWRLAVKAGRDGKNGIGIVKAEQNEDGNLVLGTSDGKSLDVGLIRGEKGADGNSLTVFNEDDDFSGAVAGDMIVGEKGSYLFDNEGGLIDLKGTDGQDGDRGLRGYKGSKGADGTIIESSYFDAEVDEVVWEVKGGEKIPLYGVTKSIIEKLTVDLDGDSDFSAKVLQLTKALRWTGQAVPGKEYKPGDLVNVGPGKVIICIKATSQLPDMTTAMGVRDDPNWDIFVWVQNSSAGGGGGSGPGGPIETTEKVGEVPVASSDFYADFNNQPGFYMAGVEDWIFQWGNITYRYIGPKETTAGAGGSYTAVAGDFSQFKAAASTNENLVEVINSTDDFITDINAMNPVYEITVDQDLFFSYGEDLYRYIGAKPLTAGGGSSLTLDDFIAMPSGGGGVGYLYPKDSDPLDTYWTYQVGGTNPDLNDFETLAEAYDFFMSPLCPLQGSIQFSLATGQHVLPLQETVINSGGNGYQNFSYGCIAIPNGRCLKLKGVSKESTSIVYNPAAITSKMIGVGKGASLFFDGLTIDPSTVAVVNAHRFGDVSGGMVDMVDCIVAEGFNGGTYTQGGHWALRGTILNFKDNWRLVADSYMIINGDSQAIQYKDDSFGAIDLWGKSTLVINGGNCSVTNKATTGDGGACVTVSGSGIVDIMNGGELIGSHPTNTFAIDLGFNDGETIPYGNADISVAIESILGGTYTTWSNGIDGSIYPCGSKVAIHDKPVTIYQYPRAYVEGDKSFTYEVGGPDPLLNDFETLAEAYDFYMSPACPGFTSITLNLAAGVHLAPVEPTEVMSAANTTSPFSAMINLGHGSLAIVGQGAGSTTVSYDPTSTTGASLFGSGAGTSLMLHQLTIDPTTVSESIAASCTTARSGTIEFDGVTVLEGFSDGGYHANTNISMKNTVYNFQNRFRLVDYSQILFLGGNTVTQTNPASANNGFWLYGESKWNCEGSGNVFETKAVSDSNYRNCIVYLAQGHVATYGNAQFIGASTDYPWPFCTAIDFDKYGSTIKVSATATLGGTYSRWSNLQNNRVGINGESCFVEEYDVPISPLVYPKTFVPGDKSFTYEVGGPDPLLNDFETLAEAYDFYMSPACPDFTSITFNLAAGTHFAPAETTYLVAGGQGYTGINCYLACPRSLAIVGQGVGVTTISLDPSVTGAETLFGVSDAFLQIRELTIDAGVAIENTKMVMQIYAQGTLEMNGVVVEEGFASGTYTNDGEFVARNTTFNFLSTFDFYANSSCSLWGGCLVKCTAPGGDQIKVADSTLLISGSQVETVADAPAIHNLSSSISIASSGSVTGPVGATSPAISRSGDSTDGVTALVDGATLTGFSEWMDIPVTEVQANGDVWYDGSTLPSVGGGGGELQGDATVAELNALNAVDITADDSWLMLDAGTVQPVGATQGTPVIVGDLVVWSAGDYFVNFGPQSGTEGPQGEKGDKGDTGDTGAAGADGAPGLPGADGADGADGAKGDTGDTGPQGIQGIQGDPGADGSDGAQGIQGEPGADGSDGAQGLPGADGADGAAGVDGKTYYFGATLPDPSGYSEGELFMVVP